VSGEVVSGEVVRDVRCLVGVTGILCRGATDPTHPI
jgi:hypothetical protein